MSSAAVTATAIVEMPGNLHAETRETHTGVVILLGDKAFKAKKQLVTDFLDFSTPELRERACAQEVLLNSRVAPASYLGVAHFSGPGGGPAEPVIVMRRYPDSCRLATLVKQDEPVKDHIVRIAETLAKFHGNAARGRFIEACATAEATTARWEENLNELHRHAILRRDSLDEVERLARRFIAGRQALFTQRIAANRIVDGHADLLADDIFCMREGPVLLDCLEFDDHLRYVDGIDDAAFLSMDLEYLGRKDLSTFFLEQYSRLACDDAPAALKDFYIAYRAVVRAKVDCVRVTQGHPDAVVDARLHLDIALDHLRAGTVRLVIVGGGPGTGKSTLAREMAEHLRAQVISTDAIRRELQQAGSISGTTGILNSGLYTAENVSAVHDAVLHRARQYLSRGQSVILDGTWRDCRQRERARNLASETSALISEFRCLISLEQASARIESRPETMSDATPEIAAALASSDDAWPEANPINTGRPLTDSMADAEEVISKCLGR